MILTYNFQMDMKKKLEGAYNPDKQDRKEKLVLGLFGLDSLVMACLLKIQKYELMAVTVVNSWDDYRGDQADILSCHLNPERIENLKAFCQKLGIPLQVVKAGAEFEDAVIGPWLADKILGKKPKNCWNCHELRMKILHDKMIEAGANQIATGHYAKLFHNESLDSVYVHTSSDETHDQSTLISRLPHYILKALMLPFSDLTRKDVLKLAQNFGLNDELRKIPPHHCLKMTPEVSAVVLKKIPKVFLQEGEITSLDGSDNFGKHLGVFKFAQGEYFEANYFGRQKELIFAKYSYPDKRILLSEESYFLRDKFMLINCTFSEEVSWLGPAQGFVVLQDDKHVECWIFLKTLKSVSIELSDKTLINPGDIISVVKKKGKNAKIFLTGEIHLLPIHDEIDEGEQNVRKASPHIDF